MFQYVPFEEELTLPDLGKCRSFGIIALDEAGNTITSVSGVSTDRQLVEEICQRCTRCRLSPVHLNDVIEDSISEYSDRVMI